MFQRVAFLTALCLAFVGNGFGAVQSLYLDSANAATGDGSQGNPYHSFASIKWTTVQGWVTAGDEVQINLRRGSVFKEIVTIAASGVANQPISFRDYDTGAKPVISGETTYTNWTVAGFSPNVWQTPAPSQPARLWLADSLLGKAPNTTALGDMMWYWNAGILYLRLDSGNPDAQGLTVKGSIRANAILVSGLSFLSFTNLVFANTSSYSVRTSGGTHDLTFDDCEWVNSDGALSLDTSSNIVFRACTFNHIYGNQSALLQGVNTAASFYFCLFTDQQVSTVLNILASGPVKVANCDFIGSASTVIGNVGTGIVELANSIVSGNGTAINTSGLAPLKGNGTNVVVHNSLVLPNPYNQAKQHMIGVVEAGGNFYQDPRYMSVDREGVVSLITDDYENYDDWITYANLASQRGFPATLALSKTDQLKPLDVSKLQAMIDQGHDIVSHTRSHADLRKPIGLYIQYVGTGSSCQLSISGNHLNTMVTGGPGGENLDIDLLDPKYDKTEELVTYLDALPGYTSRLYTVYNHEVPSRLLLETNVDVKTEILFPYDSPGFYTNEVVLSRQDVQNAFRARDGGPYITHGFVYPGGYADDPQIPIIQAAGYWGGRSTTPNPLVTHLEHIDLFQLPVPSDETYGYMLMLRFEGNGTDQSPNANNFNPVNMAYSTDAFRHSFAGNFNGTNSYMTHAPSDNFDFRRGNWHFSAEIKARASTHSGTLFATTNASGTTVRIALTPDRAIRVAVSTNGVELFNFGSSAGTITTGIYQKVSVQELFDRWFLRIDNKLLTTVTNSARVNGGTIFIGSAGDTDFYDGLMDDAVVSNGTYYKTQALLDMLCQVGGAMPQITHGESGAPREILRIFLDAIKDYTGRIKVLGFDDFLAYIRSKGNIGPDGRTLVCTNLGHAANYHLRGDSPCVRHGAASILSGVANLHDIDGNIVTDGQGNIVLEQGAPDIGAYVYLKAAAPRVSVEKTAGPDSLVVTLTGDESGYFDLQQSTNLIDWTSFTSGVGSLMATPAPPQKMSFFRGVVVETQ